MQEGRTGDGRQWFTGEIFLAHHDRGGLELAQICDTWLDIEEWMFHLSWIGQRLFISRSSPFLDLVLLSYLYSVAHGE